MVVRHSRLVMSTLIVLKAVWWSVDQLSQAWSVSFVVSGVNTCVSLVSWEKNWTRYCMSLRKAQMLVADFSAGQSRMYYALEESALIHVTEI